MMSGTGNQEIQCPLRKLRAFKVSDRGREMTETITRVNRFLSSIIYIKSKSCNTILVYDILGYLK